MSSESEAPPAIRFLEAGWLGFFVGVQVVLAGGWAVLTRSELRRDAGRPLLLTALIYFPLGLGVILLAPELLERLWPRQDGFGWWFLWWCAALALVLVLWLVLGALFFTVFGWLAGPAYERLARRIFQSFGLVTRETPALDFLLSVCIRLGAFVLPALLLGLLGFLPGVGPVFLALAALMGWLALASDVFEPGLGALGLTPGARFRYLLRAAPIALGVGATLTLSLLVPVLPVLSIPAAVVGVCELIARAQTAGPT